MFLQLLVSQLKNQDPLNPVDGTQFVSQLSQFSELEQLIAIRTDIETPANNNANAAAANTSSNAAGASATPSGAASPTATPSTQSSSGSPSTHTQKN
jgi:flagellar hook assembly protein FlgD